MSHSRTLLFALALCPLTCLPVSAQPEIAQANAVKAAQAEQAANKAWRDLQKETSRLELSEPAKAIEAYQRLYETSGKQFPAIAVSVTSRIAQLWGRGLKNPTKANEIYAWALTQWSETPYKERLQREAAAMAKLGGALTATAPAFGGVAVVDVEPKGVKPLTVAPLAIAPMKAIGAGNGFLNSMQTLGVETSPLVAGAPVRAGLQVMLAEIAAGHLSVQDAFKRGSLSVDDALHLLDGVGAWGNLAGGNEKTRRELAMLVVGQAPQKLDAPAKLSPDIRLWIGDALGEARDERAVPLLESVLSEAKARKPLVKEKDVVRTFVTIEKLSGYYNSTRQTEKAAQTWIALPILLADAKVGAATDWMIPESYFFAARAYSQSGQFAKAQPMYDQAARGGDGTTATGAIVEGFGRELQVQPDQAEIRLLQLQKEVINPDARLATHFMLAWAKYKTQKWGTFLRESEEVLIDYERIEERSRRRLFAPLALQLKDAQKWATLWQTNAIVAENPELDLQFDGPLQKPVERHIFVDTPTLTPLQVTVQGDTRRVSARIQVSPWAPELAEVRHQQIIVVTIAQGASQVDATVTITDIQNDRQLIRFPVKVSVLKEDYRE